MFYMKHKETKLEIRDDNVYATCCGCGKELKIDIPTFFTGGNADLYSTNVYCEGCCGQRVKSKGYDPSIHNEIFKTVRTEEFHQASQQLGEHINTLQLGGKENEQLVALIEKQVNVAELGAFKRGVRLGFIIAARQETEA